MLFMAAALLLACAAIAASYALRATVLTIAVAPRDGTEPELIKAYADALDSARMNVRLKILPFDGVEESAAALQDGRADLAVVRPDVSLPSNALTLAILRDQAMIIASPAKSGIDGFAKLDRKRLGIVAHEDADFEILKRVMSYYGLTLEATNRGGPVPADTVYLVSVTEAELADALRTKKVDAVVSVIAASAPKAIALVDIVRSASPDGKVAFVDVTDEDAIIERMPLLQAVTMQGGLFGGRPEIPGDDIKTIGASYRLMARASLDRNTAADITQHLFELRSALAKKTDAANYMLAPSYDTTAAATSARLPIHPGAIDFYEREQRSFMDRYSDSVYLLALVGGGFWSGLAWLHQRVQRLRRERIDVIIERLLEIRLDARSAGDSAALHALSAEINDLAADVVDYTRLRNPETQVLMAVSVAIDAANATVAEGLRARQGEAETPAMPAQA